MRDEALGVGSFEVKAEGSAVRGEAQAALQAGVRFHGGVARPELVCEPLEGVRDADTEGAEALAVAFEGEPQGPCSRRGGRRRGDASGKRWPQCMSI